MGLKIAFSWWKRIGGTAHPFLEDPGKKPLEKQPFVAGILLFFEGPLVKLLLITG